MSMGTEEPIIFPPFQLDAANQRLRRGDQSITLRPKAFALLLYLVKHPDQLVTKVELLEACWPETSVTDTVLKVCIREIREALADNPKSPKFIETAHRRGYRFIGQIEKAPARDRDPEAHQFSEPALQPGNGPNDQIPEEAAYKKPPKRGDSGRLVLHSPLPPSPPAAVGLVGRESALARLRALLARVRGGERQVVFITGEAGIGKTSLVEVFLKEVISEPQVLVGRGQCLEQYGSGEAYLPVLEAISRLCQDHRRAGLVDLLRQQAPTWLQQLPWLLEEGDWESLQRAVIGATRERMLREMAEALESLTAERPLVLVLEDLHWGDYSTLDLVSYLARRRKAAQLLLIATYRPVDVAVSDHPLKGVKQDLQAHRQCEEIPLEYLHPEAVNDYLTARYSQHELPNALAALLHQRTDGNPFFLVNAVDYLQAEALIAKRNAHWCLTVPLGELEVGVPESIRQMIEKQIERVDREQQRVLEVAAIAGLEFSTSAVAAGLEQTLLHVEEQCEQLARRQLFLRATGVNIYPDGTVTARYAFIHALYQEVLYQRVAAGRRARLHQLIGGRGEELYGEYGNEVAAELAMHFEQGHDYRRAVKYLRQAAQNHLLRYANREAIAYLGKALDLVKQLPENERAEAHMAILEQAGLARRAMGDMGGAAANFEALAEYAGELGRKEDEVKALAHLSTVLSWVDRERCLSAARRSMALSHDITDESLRAHVRGSWGYWHVLFLGWGDDHMESLAAAVVAARAAGDHEMLGLHLARYSFLECLRSDYTAAIGAAEEAAQHGLQTSDAHTYLLAQYFEAWALLHAGRWGEMRRILDHGLEMAQRNQHTRWAVLFLLELGWLHEQSFDFEIALQMCKQAHEQAKTIQHPYTELLSLILLGFAHIGLEQQDDAFRCLSEAAERLAREHILMDWVLRILLHYALSRYWLSQGKPEEARRDAERVCELATPPGERTYLALAHLVIAEIAIESRDWNAADAAVSQSMNVLEGVHAPLAEWRVGATAARLQEQKGRTEQAAQHRRRGLEVLNQLAESLDETDRLRHSLVGSTVAQSIRRGA
jgi:DNA-binding winged helix-turn-helix (wHTH) protein/tetratricopeptide (TPR) repeat protein/CheY-like chemotaxis protein